MKNHFRFLLPVTALAVLLGSPAFLAAQQGGTTTPAQQNNQSETVVDGWRGYLSIDYRGGKFIVPYARIVSISQVEYIVDGGGKVHELTIDTSGQATARFYFLDTVLANSNLNAGQIINNRLNSVRDKADEKTGVDTRTVVKHYPDTTHAKTIEFNVSARSHLDVILNHVTHEWIEEGGRGDGRTLKFE